VFHRVRFRQGDKEAMLRIANREALTALAVMSVSIPAAVFLVTDVLHGFSWGVSAGMATFIVVLLVWWSVPLRRRQLDRAPSAARSAQS
jgi:Flp pilus assembly protein TadB